MTEVRTFRAASMKDALDLVRQEMGADAVILHTQQVRRRRFFPWSNPVAHVEVTAGLGINIRPPAAVSRQKTGVIPQKTGVAHSPARQKTPPAENRPPAVASSRNVTSSGPSAPAAKVDRPLSVPSAPAVASNDAVTFERTSSDSLRARAMALFQATSQRNGTQTRSSSPHPEQRSPQTGGHPPVQKSSGPPAAHSASATVTQPLDPASPRSVAGVSVNGSGISVNGSDNGSNNGSGKAGATGESPVGMGSAEFSEKLNAIHRMLGELGQRRLFAHGENIPAELFQLYTNLIDAEVEDDIARELISRLKESTTPQQLQNTESALTVLTAMVENEVPCCGPILPTPGQRKVVALVGSTGVGKTTTIAKLAANFRLRDGVKMGLVTVDTYRIAAVEQLRTYAEIIDLPMRVVTSPPEMRRALEELAGLDLVLIDTAGRSPRDELQIQELKSLLSEACVDEVHLVMNLTASSRTLTATAKKFAAAGTTALIMTKLDEAAGLGALLSVARQVKLPFSYLTTGQDVPDDIEPAHATRIARLILGREKLAS